MTSFFFMPLKMSLISFSAQNEVFFFKSHPNVVVECVTK